MNNVGLLHLEVITPERVMVSEDVDMVEAPGAMGEFGVLPGHINFPHLYRARRSALHDRRQDPSPCHERRIRRGGQ